MIEIIVESVEMPKLTERKFHKNPLDLNGKKWNVIDIETNIEVYKGNFQNASIACHNLNKKYYRDLPKNL